MLTKAADTATFGAVARAVAILSGSYVEEDGLAMEDLIWRAVTGAGVPARLVVDCDFLLMVSIDSLDGRGISCMTVGGLLHRIPEHTRVDNGAFALLQAHAMAATGGRTVCLLGWEKPSDVSAETLPAMAGEPHYERPLGWTAGVEEALAASRRSGGTITCEDDRPLPHDRAVCIVLGPGTAPGPRLSVRRRTGATGAAASLSPLAYPVRSPVSPLRRVAERAAGTDTHHVGAGCQIEVEVEGGTGA